MSVRNFLKITNRAACFYYRPIILYKNRFVVPRSGKFLSTVAETSEITTGNNDNSFKGKIRQSTVTRNDLRQFLLENPNYANLIFEPTISITKSSRESLRILKQFCDDPNDENLLTQLPDVLRKELNYLTFAELLETTYLVLKCCKINQEADIWFELMKDLDVELLNRFKSKKIHRDVLRSLDLLYHSAYFKHFKYFHYAMLRTLAKIKSLTNEQLVHLMYLIVPFHESLLKDKKFNAQLKILDALQHLSLQEIAFLYYGFIKLRIFFTLPKIISTTVEKIIKNVEHLDSTSLQLICDGMSKLPKSNKFKGAISDFQEKMIPHISKFSPSSLVSLLLTNVHNNQMNNILAEKVIEKVKEDISMCNKIALERLLFLTVQFNIEDKELVKLVTEAVESILKAPLRNDFYSFVIKILNHLIHLQVYPDSLLRHAMKIDFLELLFSVKFSTAVVQWNFINNCLKLDNPQYYCEGVSKQKLKRIFHMKVFANFEPRERISYYTTNFSLDDSLSEIYGKEKVFWNSPLLHYPEIVLMIFDRNFEPRVIPEEFKVTDKGVFEMRKPLDDDNFWFCFLTVTYENFAGTYDEINLVTRTKIRQFNKAGFKPILVTMKDFKMHKNNKTEHTFLRDLINKKITEAVEQEKIQSST